MRRLAKARRPGPDHHSRPRDTASQGLERPRKALKGRTRPHRASHGLTRPHTASASRGRDRAIACAGGRVGQARRHAIRRAPTRCDVRAAVCSHLQPRQRSWNQSAATRMAMPTISAASQASPPGAGQVMARTTAGTTAKGMRTGVRKALPSGGGCGVRRAQARGCGHCAGELQCCLYGPRVTRLVRRTSPAIDVRIDPIVRVARDSYVPVRFYCGLTSGVNCDGSVPQTVGRIERGPARAPSIGPSQHRDQSDQVASSRR